MLLFKGKITQELVDMLMSWRHSGFNVHCGQRIQPGDEKAMENLARYIIRASFSQERMTYLCAVVHYVELHHKMQLFQASQHKLLNIILSSH